MEFPPNKFTFAVDLFGEPLAGPRGPGRPRHLPTEAQRELVAKLHSEGLDQVKIAEAIGITGPTLRLNYPSELESRSCTAARRLRRDERKD